MFEDKPWFLSRTVWAVLVMLVTVLLSRFGYVITPEIQEGIVSLALDVVAVGSGIVALWGRIVATKKLQ
jgi:uncharacterized protein (DUF697 family)